MVGISVVDPVSVKEQMLKPACEATGMVFRIDDTIAVRRQGYGNLGGMMGAL